MSQRKHLGEYLVKAGLLTETELQEALSLQKKRGGFFGQILVEEEWITEQQLCQALAETLHIHWADLSSILIAQDTLRRVPRSIAVTCNVLPIFIHHNTIHLAMEHPCETLIKFIEKKSGLQVRPFFAPLQQLRTMIKEYYYENRNEDALLQEA